MLNKVSKIHCGGKPALCGKKLGKAVWLLGGMVVFLPTVIFSEEKMISQVSATGLSDYLIWSIAVAVIGLAFVGMFGTISMSSAIGKALEGMARQPEAGGQLQLVLIIGLAFIESLVLYVLFIAIILLFANPFIKYFVQ